jgi:hypothetical protein
MHEDDKRLACLLFHHQRFNHAVPVHTELPCRFGGATVLDVIVRMLIKSDTVLAQQLRRGRLRDMLDFGQGDLPARMMLRMNLLKPLSCHMRVDLRGGNVSMAQQQLHHAQIGAVVQQMRGKCMAQGVR